VTAPVLAFYWGDDELQAQRALDEFAAALEADAGSPLERWSTRGADGLPETQIARIGLRLASPVLFGAGTLSILSGVGPLVRKNENRDALLAAIAAIAPGNALAIVEATESGRKSPPHKPIADAVLANGGLVRKLEAPREGALAGWIEREARTRSVTMASGAAKELATRIGGFVRENDATRGHQTRLAAMELEKLALYRPDAPVTAADVRALAPEGIPSSIFALTDAIGMRRPARAVELLERHFEEGRPEPVLISTLHRRIRELIEVADRLARGEPPGSLVVSMKLAPYRAQILVEQARRWTVDELVAALEGLIDLDASLREPGPAVGEGKRRMAFELWIVERVAHD
jgi:DNA polymerase-3 subunit delta